MKMAEISFDLRKILFSILFIIHMKCNFAQLNAIDLSIFDYNSTNLGFIENTRENVKCLNEISAIKNGVKNMETWAIKVIDAWGKLPSGILEGNLIELGSFSECFDIERKNNKYESKYCTGRIAVTLNGIEAPTLNNVNLNNALFPNVLRLDDMQITPRGTNSMPKDLIIGLCLPAACHMDFLQKIVNNNPINKTMSIKLNENMCQLEEYPTGLRTIDWVTIVILAIVSFFIVMSTGYDILCTVYELEKSQAMLAFSFYSNGKKLLSYKKSRSPEMMNCLHGIRVISTAWVVLGHTFSAFIGLPTQNLIAAGSFTSKYRNMVILSALISVDTFFVMSGLLVSINILKHLEKTKGRINVPLLYIHRYLRLTPLVGVTILFSISLMRLMGNGPLWPQMFSYLFESCRSNWWIDLLYIQNYVNPDKMCLIHTWYLAVDTQLFIISPLVVYLIYRFKAKAVIAMVLLVFGCVGLTLAVYLLYDLTNAHPQKINITYLPTHIRYGSWLIGVIAGYIFTKARNRTIRIPKLFNLFAWTLSLAIMVTVIFANYPLQQLHNTHTPLEFGLYDALCRVGWSIALCYIIFACVHNSGGPVGWFLGHPLWQPLSRICYAIYILHYIVVMIMMFQVKTTIYFSELTAFQTFIGNFVMTVFISIIATLAFESPIIIIEKMLLGPRKKTHSDGCSESKINEEQYLERE